MKLKQAIPRTFKKRKNTDSQGEKRKRKQIKVSVIEPKKYLYTLEAVHDDINCIVTVIDNETDREIERRYGKKRNINSIISKTKDNYKKIKVNTPIRILSEIKIPQNTYEPKSKTKKSLYDYSSRIYTNTEKFTKVFQELADCLDEYRMRVDIEYHSTSTGKYVIDMIPKSNNMASGLHRITVDVINNKYSYFYGIEITKLRCICKTDSITKLFE